MEANYSARALVNVNIWVCRMDVVYPSITKPLIT